MRSEGLVIIAAIVAAFLVGWQAANWEPEQQQAECLDSERFFCEPGPSIWITDPNGIERLSNRICYELGEAR